MVASSPSALAVVDEDDTEGVVALRAFSSAFIAEASILALGVRLSDETDTIVVVDDVLQTSDEWNIPGSQSTAARERSMMLYIRCSFNHESMVPRPYFGKFQGDCNCQVLGTTDHPEKSTACILKSTAAPA